MSMVTLSSASCRSHMDYWKPEDDNIAYNYVPDISLCVHITTMSKMVCGIGAVSILIFIILHPLSLCLIYSASLIKKRSRSFIDALQIVVEHKPCYSYFGEHERLASLVCPPVDAQIHASK